MKSLCLLFLVSLAALPETGRAALSATERGARWLQAELPASVGLQSADCEQLAAAVGRATLAHLPEAPAILGVALTRSSQPRQRGDGGRLPSGWAARILSISAAAAPLQASALLDLTTDLYPDCAADLAGVLRDYDSVSYDYKDRANDKDVVAARNAPDAATDPANVEQPTFGPRTQTQHPGDLSDQDVAGLGFGDGYGGITTGFPGSPGFVGSPPDGGLALPPAALTAAVNG